MLTIIDYPFRIFHNFNLGRNLQQMPMKIRKNVYRLSRLRPWVAGGLLLGLCALLSGCQAENTPNRSVLMRIGDRVVTVDEYKRELNIYRTATGISSEEDGEADRETQIRFVRQMADQLVLLEHARAIGVDVTDRELEIALKEIRRDYPDDVFEQLLLENAITLEEWKASLRTRLVIDRVIRQELEEHIRISEEDMAAFMARFNQDRQATEIDPEAAESPAPSDKTIVNQLRRSKTENAYAAWMTDLKQRYPIEINQTVLNEVIPAAADTAKASAADDRRQP
ncbi:MAG: SurA N-terminal domain-containing protein [Desulfobacterales bacterium]|jgi:hypothetical protein